MKTLPGMPLKSLLRAGLDLSAAAAIGLAMGWGAHRAASPARTPAEAPPSPRPRIPLTVLARHIYREFTDDRVAAVSAGVAFFALLSLFPALAVLVSTYGLLASPSDMVDLMATAGTLLPDAANELIRDQVVKLAEASKTSLGVAWAFALLLSLWSANGAMKSLTDALNVAYDVQEQRGFFQHNALTLALTFGALAMVAGLLLVTAAIPAILDRFWLGWASETLLNYGRWPMLLLLLITGLALLYRFGPNLPNARWRWISPGSVVASTGLIVFSILFSWYAVNFGNYNKTYGSLGAVIAFMTWTWLSTMIVLIGAELNAVLDKLQRPARSWWLKVAPR